MLTQQSCECLTQQSCDCLTQQSCDFERKASSVEKHSSSDSLENSFFENSPVPSLATPKSFTLGNDQIHLSLLSLNQDFSPEEGLHLSLLNPLPPQEGKDLKPGRLGLYEQTSFNCVDSRLHSAEHSSELDALLSLARELRVFMRRGRGCAFWGGK